MIVLLEMFGALRRNSLRSLGSPSIPVVLWQQVLEVSESSRRRTSVWLGGFATAAWDGGLRLFGTGQGSALAELRSGGVRILFPVVNVMASVVLAHVGVRLLLEIVVPIVLVLGLRGKGSGAAGRHSHLLN